MMAVFLLGILVGLDNLEVGAGIGLVPMRTARRLGIALSCFVCETGIAVSARRFSGWGMMVAFSTAQTLPRW